MTWLEKKKINQFWFFKLIKFDFVKIWYNSKKSMQEICIYQTGGFSFIFIYLLNSIHQQEEVRDGHDM